MEPPLHIALVEPQIPPNTGNIARLCAATGCALHLVEPLGFRIDDRELRRAGLDYWGSVNLTVHQSFEAFMGATQAGRRWFFSTRAKRRYDEAGYALGDFLIFGKETTGLPPQVLQLHEAHAMRIPMRGTAVRSLNLSTAVGIVTYAALCRLNFPNLT
ncbi:MAG: tRNA (cytidine(34)-2'-O)-methyltransferase [Candidatus Eremiobacteraeota bacterium]|nr:tRNA (cytidine(34)-2'-O)-methyltransferase [Candidatus Eremiobacteraeota bacterium]